MTDNEIIKALKCCANLCEDGCNGCYLVPSESKDAYCMDKLTKDAIDLINRQKEEISKKDIEIDILIRKKEDLSDEVERLGDSNKRLKEAVGLMLNNDNGVELIKTEAYKEFAEKLLKRKYLSSDWSHGEHPYVVEESDIEDLLYELT
jgi:hypothetical protein